jgi:hypothetical protein
MLQERRSTMRAKNLLLCLLVATGTLLAPLASEADTRVNVGISVGPPLPPAVVVAPAPTPGYVWAPGYYAWDGYQYVWVGGRWMAPRRGYAWVPDRWERRGPQWYHVQGHWNRGYHGRGHP